MLIRAFRVGDEPDLHQVFLSAIYGIAIKDYWPEQVAAWAPRSVGPDLWADRMRGIGRPVACADVQQMTSDVSRTAQPFFKFWGFSIVEERQVIRRGVVIPNTFMKKEL
jgi:putative acetyltransferase